jgi:hypothetical protein
MGMYAVSFDAPMPLTAHQVEVGVVECREMRLGDTVIGRIAHHADGHAVVVWKRAELLQTLVAIIQAEHAGIATVEMVEW